jgi:uncharacterized phage protein gp47/JayE
MYEDRTEENIKQEMLDNITDKVDKTENSFVHDAISPAAIKFAEAYIDLEVLSGKLDVENLEGDELERYVYQHSGIERRPATKARGTVRVEGEEGARVSRGDLVAAGDINFIVLESKDIGVEGFTEVEVECEELGTIGNVPADAITQFPISILGITNVYNPEPATGGYEEESDRELLERYYEKIKTPAISGNKHHYLVWAKEVVGVGDARVIPLWDGPGTVKVVIIDSNKEPASQALIDEVSKHIEEERPIGADVTVTSAQPKKIDMELTIIKDEMHTLEQVKANIRKGISDYFAEVAFRQDFISYAHIGRVLLDCEGVLDYSDLTINGDTENITLDYEEIPILDEVIVHE